MTLRLGLAEGVETAISVASSFRRDEGRFEPLWAALSAGNMAELEVVDGIETIVVYADHGQGGEAPPTSSRSAGCSRSGSVHRRRSLDDWNPAVESSA